MMADNGEQRSESNADLSGLKSSVDFNTSIKLDHIQISAEMDCAKSEEELDSSSLDGDFGVDCDDEDDEEDDEMTLKEEEELEDDDEINDELASLREESELPLDQILDLYGYQYGTSCNSPDPPSAKKPRICQSSNPRECSDIAVLQREVNFNESDSDSDYVPLGSTHKEPRVGKEFQCEISCSPLPLSSIEETSAHMAECLWSPRIASDSSLEQFLCSKLNVAEHELILQPVPDNQELLNAIFRANGDFSSVEDTEYLKPENNYFSDSDINLFEEGLRIHGKDFPKIQKLQLPHKKVGELVHFYYFWKKTERYDRFAELTKLGRNRELLDEKVTDFMYRITQDIHSFPQQQSLASREPFTRASYVPAQSESYRMSWPVPPATDTADIEVLSSEVERQPIAQNCFDTTPSNE